MMNPVISLWRRPEKLKKYILPALILLVLLLSGCTTTAPLQKENADPLAVLPEDDDFYILARPSEHPELVLEVLQELMPVEEGQMMPALSRTHTAVVSASFSDPIVFSGKMEGDYPAVFVRHSLRRSKAWTREEDKTYRGPMNIFADTLYKNTLLAATGEGRLENLQDDFLAQTEKSILSPEDLQWWQSGGSAVMFYLPDLGRIPMPSGLPSVPADTVFKATLDPVAGSDKYNLSGELTFADARNTRMWALGLRIFLAGTLGLSPVEEERFVLNEMEMKMEGAGITLDNWKMTPSSWGHFLSGFKQVR